jgi:serine/threonine protein kinase
VGEQEGFHYFVMQFVDGVGLDAVIEEHAKRKVQGGPELDAVLQNLGPPDWQGVAKVGQQVAEALYYAHEQGTLHRDIKPGNLIVGRSSNVWVTDFGLAKSEQSDLLTVSGEISGTLRYMAPEQLSGIASPQSDIYSLGVTLYELLILKPAFAETERSSLMHRVAQGPSVSSLRQEDSTIPRDLETIILKAVSRDPAHPV